MSTVINMIGTLVFKENAGLSTKFYLSPSVVSLFEQSEHKRWDKQTMIGLLLTQRTFDKDFLTSEMMEGTWTDIELETYQGRKMYSITCTPKSIHPYPSQELRQSSNTKLFAFFLRATGGPTVISTSTQEGWVERLRDTFDLPKAQVTIIQEDQWNPPSLNSVDNKTIQENFEPIRKAIKEALITQGVPTSVLDDITRDVATLSNPLTRLVIFVVRC